MAGHEKQNRGPRRMAECEKKAGGGCKTLKGLRINSGMKQSEIASLLGVSKYTVSSWERGIHIPSWTHLTVLAGILNVRTVDLACILGMVEDTAEADPVPHDHDSQLAARGQVGIVSEILYLFTLLDEQGKNTVRTALEIPEKGVGGHDHVEGT